MNAIMERFTYLLDSFHQATIGNQAGGSRDDDASQVADGPDQPNNQADVCNIHTDCDLTFDRHGSGEDKAEQHLKAQYDIREGPEHRMHEKQYLALQIFAPVILLEFTLFVILSGKSFD